MLWRSRDVKGKADEIQKDGKLPIFLVVSYQLVLSTFDSLPQDICIFDPQLSLSPYITFCLAFDPNFNSQDYTVEATKDSTMTSKSNSYKNEHRGILQLIVIEICCGQKETEISRSIHCSFKIYIIVLSNCLTFISNSKIDYSV